VTPPIAVVDIGYETISPPKGDNQHTNLLVPQGSDVSALLLHAAPTKPPAYQLVQLKTPTATGR
jgi:hypothetical protein